MANQIIIDIGAAANDGTGDPLRTAFNYVNNNFSNVWNTGLPTSNVQFLDNKILTVNTNANLVLAPNGTGAVQSNVNILPNIANAHNLGGPGRRWNTVYSKYANIISANIASANISDVNLGNVGTLEIDVNNLHITGGTNGYVLQTDGEGNLSWTAQTGGGGGNGVPGGANTQIQFNNAGSFGGHPNFTFNSVTHLMTTPGNIVPVANITQELGSTSLYWKNLYVGNVTGGNISLTGDIIGLGNLTLLSGNISAGNSLIGQLVTATNINANTGTFYGDSYGDGAIYVGTPAGTILGSDVVMQITANAGGYSQTNFQNTNSGPTASGDYILTADNGDDTTHYLDMGITSSGWDNTETNVLSGLAPNNGYLYVQDGNLTLGTRDGSTSYSWNFDTTGVLTVAGDIVPVANNTQSLGSATNQWKDLWVSNATIYLDSNPLTVGAGNILTFDGNAIVTQTSNNIANIGNFVFNGNSLQNINGGSYNNGDLAHGATAGLNLATNGSGTTLLYNSYGDLSLQTRQNSDILFNTQRIAGATTNWVDTYGELTNDVNNTVGESCVMDSGGNVYVTGSCYNPDISNDVGFLRKLSPVGVVLWEVAAPDPSTFVDTIATAGEIVWESGGTVWWLFNCWGTQSHWAVMKIDGSTGSQIWTTEVVGGGYAADMTVSSTGVCYVTPGGADGGQTPAQLTAIDINGNKLWSKQPGEIGMSVIARSDGVIMVGGNAGAVWGYDTSGNALWTKYLFNGGDSIWGLAWDGAAWYAAGRETGLVAKVNGTDNDTVVWQKQITVQFSSWSTTWMEYSSWDGNLYITGVNSDQFERRGFATVKMAANTGALVWANSLVANSPGQWWNWGHHDLTVYRDYYAVTGNANTNGAAHERQVLAKLPTDGTLTGETVGDYQYVSMTNIAVVTDTSSSDFNPSPGDSDATTTENGHDVDPATIPTLQNLLNYFQYEYQWSIDHFGNLVTGGSITNGNIYASLNLHSATDILIESGPGIIAGADGNQINLDAGNGNIDGGDNGGRGGFVNINSGVGGDATTSGAGEGGWIELNAGAGGMANTTNNIQAGSGGTILLVAGQGGNSLGNSALTNSGGNIELYGGMGSWDVETPADKAGHIHLYGGNWGWISPSGNIYVHTNPTGFGGQEKNWGFLNTGAMDLPYVSSSQRTGSGQALKFSQSSNQKMIATTNGSADQNTVERLVISGGDSYFDGTDWFGEAGDLYMWAGAGNNGGDIKVDAGESYGASQEGGTVKIRGGYSNNGNGGFVEIDTGSSTSNAAGELNIYTGQGGTNGGNVNIVTGQGTSGAGSYGGQITMYTGQGSTSGGDITIYTGGGVANSGNISISTSATANAGNIDLTGGGGSEKPGIVNITGGGSFTWTPIKAGNVNITGGTQNGADGGGGDGGDVNIYGGQSVDAVGGNVNIGGGSGLATPGSINLQDKTYLPPNSNGAGGGEAANLLGTRLNVGGLSQTYSAAATLPGAGTESIVYYASSPAVQSVKLTVVVQTNGSSYNWEQFDVSAIVRFDGSVAVTVSNRLSYTDGAGVTAVSASIQGPLLAIALTQPTGATNGWVNYTATEFNLMAD